MSVGSTEGAVFTQLFLIQVSSIRGKSRQIPPWNPPQRRNLGWTCHNHTPPIILERKTCDPPLGPESDASSVPSAGRREVPVGPESDASRGSRDPVSGNDVESRVVSSEVHPHPRSPGCGELNTTQGGP
ncbi:hypothetical protein ACLOAV_006310 [Pseudogymnoascus australis]